MTEAVAPDLSNIVYLKNFNINNSDNTIDLNYSIPSLKLQGTLNLSMDTYNQAITQSNGTDSMSGVRLVIINQLLTQLSHLVYYNTANIEQAKEDMDKAHEALNAYKESDYHTTGNSSETAEDTTK